MSSVLSAWRAPERAPACAPPNFHSPPAFRLSIVPRDDGPWEADAAEPSAALPAAPETDPSAAEVQAQTAEPSTLLALSLMVSLIGTGLALEILFPARYESRPPAPVRLPLDTLHTRSAPALLKLAADQGDGTWRPALLELGRRGALTELAALREHRAAEVRALVPIAYLEMGPAAHAHIPWLAEGLTSSDDAVRAATRTALVQLARSHGAYRVGPARDEFRQLTHAAP